MESKNYMIKDKIYYLNNGKIAQNHPIHSTQIKNLKINNNSKVTNGKLFSNEFTLAFEEDKMEKSNQSKNKKNNLVSWVINTLNPINHIPIVSTINSMVNKTNKSLDIVQSAIGGTIYGGGPIGLAKGIGGWFLNKLMPKNEIASKPRNIKDLPSDNSTLKENTTNSQKSMESSKVNIKDIEKTSDAVNHVHSVQRKPMTHKYFYDYVIELKQKNSLINTDA